MEFLQELITSVVAITFILGFIARVIPNDKLYGWGFSLGKMAGSFGSLKMGAGWEKVETFLINSFGQFFNGVKNGLNDDDPEI